MVWPRTAGGLISSLTNLKMPDFWPKKPRALNRYKEPGLNTRLHWAKFSQEVNCRMLEQAYSKVAMILMRA